MKKTKKITAIILAFIGIIIAFQNTEPVETQLLFFKVTMPRAILLFITLAIGFVTGILVSLIFSKKGIFREK
jgi:uncharacterized integral membrane protein